MSWHISDGRSGTSEIEIDQTQGENAFKGTGVQTFEGKTITFNFTGSATDKILIMTQEYKTVTVDDIVDYKGTINGNGANGTWTNTLGTSGTWSMARK